MQSVLFTTCTRLDCCSGPVILCLKEPLASGAKYFLEATLASTDSSTGCGCAKKYIYGFTYEEGDLADPTTLLVASDINSAFCYDCFVEYAESLVQGCFSCENENICVNPVFYPECFGAEGNDSTDDTAAIQQAIDAASAAGSGTVLFSAKIYRHSGLNLKRRVTLRGMGNKGTILRYIPNTGDGITLTDTAATVSCVSIVDLKLDAVTTSTGAAIACRDDTKYVSDFYIDRYEIESFLVGIYIPYGLHVRIGFGRLLGQGKATVGGVGVQLGDRTILPTPRLVNTAEWVNCYANGFETSFVSDGSVHSMVNVTSENCTDAILAASRLVISGSWIQADNMLYTTRAGGWTIASYNNYHLNGASVEVDDISGMVNLGTSTDLGVWAKGEFKGIGNFRMRFATSEANAIRLGSATPAFIFESGGTVRIKSEDTLHTRPLDLDRNQAAAYASYIGFLRQGVVKAYLGLGSDDYPSFLDTAGTHRSGFWDNANNLMAGEGALGTTATDGFLYVPTCQGTPTGVPTAHAGYSPIVVDVTNHKLYFYDGAWRDAGP